MFGDDVFIVLFFLFLFFIAGIGAVLFYFFRKTIIQKINFRGGNFSMKELLRKSIIIRIILVTILTLILLIPATMVQDLVHERQNRRDNAVLEVTEKWGQQQTIGGPILSVPYLYTWKNDSGKTFWSTGYAHFLPEKLNVEGELFPEIRHRGMYDVVLYKSVSKISGTFSPPNFSEFSIDEKNILWEDAFLSMGVSDLKGISSDVTIQWNELQIEQEAVNIKNNDVFSSGISIEVPLKQKQEYKFSFELKLNGSSEINFLPVGKQTEVKISSQWGTPSFIGAYLPESRTVQNDKFSAQWKIFHLNRNYPQQWLNTSYNIVSKTKTKNAYTYTDDEYYRENYYNQQQSSENSAFGVMLRMAVDEYQKNTRTVKYAIMFIALTFLSFFMTELLNKKILHPIQYLLIGIALVLFYTLLLSLSEQLGFNLAYWIASLAIISSITLYTKSVLSNNTVTMVIAGILVLLYGFLFMILQLEDYALLFGSIGLFMVLVIVMYLTRKIDWFAVGKTQENSQA